jgi:MscS family membrane protein
MREMRSGGVVDGARSRRVRLRRHFDCALRSTRRARHPVSRDVPLTLVHPMIDRPRRRGARQARRALALLLLACAAALPTPAAAQQPDTDAPAKPTDIEALDSPRAAMRHFLEASEQEDWALAAGTLQRSPRTAGRSQEVAERVYRFIRRRVLVDLDSISPLSEGDVADGARETDRVGRMFLGVGRYARPIELVRVPTTRGTRWLITTRTLATADSVSESLDRSWARRNLPSSITREGPFEIRRWKWLAGMIGVPLVWLITMGLASLLRRAALAVARRTKATWDDAFVERLRGPFRLFVGSALSAVLPVMLELDAATASLTFRTLRGAAMVAVFWGLLRLVGVAQEHLTSQAWGGDQTSARTVVPLVGRTLKFALGLAALLVALSEFGYPVGTVLAGLGLGGLVLALAAQKTVENLFGSLSLAADRVFRIGDWVRVEGVEGSVERIGLRSTHLRTNDRTVIKIPNGKLADARVESFGERDRIRFHMTLQLDRATTAGQLRAVLAGVEGLIHAHPRVWPEGAAVRFVALSPQSLDVSVTAWLVTTVSSEFEVMRQELLLGILDVVERAGTRLAVPMQVLRVEGNTIPPERVGALSPV